MKIDHIAIWCKDIETIKDFYLKYFNTACGEIYINKKNFFKSYFLTFESGSRLEIMQKTEIPDNINPYIDQYLGIIHIAISVGSKEKVSSLTEKLRKDGYSIAGEPRLTGDGYFESVIFDPENNRIEIVE